MACLAMRGVVMKVGDLVDDGFDNIGFIVEVGWGCSTNTQDLAYLVHFPADTTQNGWYSIYDLKKVFPPAEVICK